MPYDLFWNGEPRAAKWYRDADIVRINRTNQELWLQGRYIYEAILDCVPVLNPFSKEHKPTPYPSEPYPLTRDELEQREKEKQEAKQQAMLQRMNDFAKNFNEKINGSD